MKKLVCYSGCSQVCSFGRKARAEAVDRPLLPFLSVCCSPTGGSGSAICCLLAAQPSRHTKKTPTTSIVFNNRASPQPALIASFIPIYFCHPDNLRERPVESGGTPLGLRLLVSILSRQSFLLSSITGGDFNQMTCDGGIKYPRD